MKLPVYANLETLIASCTASATEVFIKDLYEAERKVRDIRADWSSIIRLIIPELKN